MKIVGTHHIALITPNFDRLRDFYIQTLGLAVAGGFHGQGILFIDAGSTAIELIEQTEATAGRPGSWAHFAFQVEDVDATYEALKKQGISFHVLPKDFPSGRPSVRIAFFKDPDGNDIELVQPLGPRYPPADQQ